VAVGVTQWEAARLEPPVFAIGPTDAMLKFVRRAGLYGMLPGNLHPRKVDRVNRITRTPFLQFLKRATEVIKDLAVDVRDLALGRHDRDETRNRLNDEAEALFAADIDNCSHELQVAELSQKGQRSSRPLRSNGSFIHARLPIARPHDGKGQAEYRASLLQ